MKLCEHFLIINKHSHIQGSLDDGYSNRWLKLIWEKLDTFCGEKLKEMLLKTQENHFWKTLFWYESLSSKTCRETLWKIEKTSFKTSLKILLKIGQRPYFIELRKLAVEAQDDLSVDRPVDRLTIIFMTIWFTDRPPGRPSPGHREIFSLTVDQHPTESWVKPVGRPSLATVDRA